MNSPFLPKCFYSHIPFQVREVAAMLKAIHAQENKESARQKAKSVVQKLREMKLREASDKIEKGIEETLTYMDFPYAHWSKLRSNNVIERLNREIRRVSATLKLYHIPVKK